MFIGLFYRNVEIKCIIFFMYYGGWANMLLNLFSSEPDKLAVYNVRPAIDWKEYIATKNVH